MKLCDQFVNLIRNRIETEFPPSRIGRHRKLDIADGIQQLFKLIRTGMQWREVQPSGVAPITLYKHAQRWFRKGVFKRAYRHLLRVYRKRNAAKWYCMDSTMVK